MDRRPPASLRVESLETRDVPTVIGTFQISDAPTLSASSTTDTTNDVKVEPSGDFVIGGSYDQFGLNYSKIEV